RRQRRRQRQPRAHFLLARRHHAGRGRRVPRPPRPLPPRHLPRRSHQPSARSAEYNHSHPLQPNHGASSTNPNHHPHPHHHRHQILSLEQRGPSGSSISAAGGRCALETHGPRHRGLFGICVRVSWICLVVEDEGGESRSSSCCCQVL